MTINTHVHAETALSYRLWRDKWPWVTVAVGDHSGGVTLFFRDAAELAALGQVVEKARQELAEATGFLPNGEPCAYVEAFGSIEWDEHDHGECLATLVDEPDDPDQPPLFGTAWERHDDPTAGEWSR